MRPKRTVVCQINTKPILDLEIVDAFTVETENIIWYKKVTFYAKLALSMFPDNNLCL